MNVSVPIGAAIVTVHCAFAHAFCAVVVVPPPAGVTAALMTCVDGDTYRVPRELGVCEGSCTVKVIACVFAGAGEDAGVRCDAAPPHPASTTAATNAAARIPARARII